MINDSQFSPRPYWLYYFVVDDIDAGTDRVKTYGGTVLLGLKRCPVAPGSLTPRIPRVACSRSWA